MEVSFRGKSSDRVSSEKLLAVSAGGPPAAFFSPEIDMSGFFGPAHFGEKCDFAQILADLVYFNLEILKDWNPWTSGPFQDHGIGTLGLLDLLGQDLFLANQAGWGVPGAIAPR